MNASIPEKPKRVLAEDIYRAIKEDILGVDILPGAILDEVQLMSRFGVSRTPIREAIRRLISDDLVGMEPHRSAYVIPLTIESIREFFEAYELIQRMVLILSADRINSEQIRSISSVDEKIAAAFEARDIRLIRKLNDEFYGSVAAASSNKFLQELYSKLREFSSRLSALIHKSLLGDEWDEHADTLRRDHEKIISALSAKDCALIGDISDQDVALFKKKILQALERRIPDCAKFDAPKRGDISS